MRSSRAGSNNCILWQELSDLDASLTDFSKTNFTASAGEGCPPRRNRWVEKLRSRQQPTPGDPVSVNRTVIKRLTGAVCRLKQASASQSLSSAIKRGTGKVAVELQLSQKT
jgi:hypothetical protein